MLAALFTTVFGAVLGWFISSRTAKAQWQKERKARELDRLEALTEELHLAVMRVLMLPEKERHQKGEPWRAMRDAMVLTSARSKTSCPKFSSLVCDMGNALQAGETDFDIRSVLTGLAALTSMRLEDPDVVERETWTVGYLVELGAAQERKRRGLPAQ